MAEVFSDGRAPRDERPRDAATVVVLRDRGGGRGPEVLLMRRHGRSAFMAGAYVFPGGALDAADRAPHWSGRVDPAGARRLVDRLEPTGEAALEPATALGLGIAAIRELFEESGLLLARTPEGALPDGRDAEAARRLHAGREALNAGRVGFADLLEAEGLVPDLALLTYWAHWITPSVERRRFDARFFLARLPEGQTPLVDQAELTHQVWRTPDEALADAEAGRMVLPPPTVRTLEELVSFDSVEAALAAGRTRPVAPILPKIATEGERLMVLLPWDPDYLAADGEGLERPGGAPPAGGSRLVLEDGHWISR